MEHNLKAQEPHLELADKISNEIIENFNGIQQFQFLKQIHNNIESYYKSRIDDDNLRLKQSESLRDDFIYGDQERPKISVPHPMMHDSDKQRY